MLIVIPGTSLYRVSLYRGSTVLLFFYFFIFLQGETARIIVQNGDIYEGILKAVSPKVRNGSKVVCLS